MLASPGCDACYVSPFGMDVLYFFAGKNLSTMFLNEVAKCLCK